MAQKLFTTYRASVESFPLGEQLVGLVKPGRYNGYDQPTSINGDLNISLNHSGIIPKTDKDGNFTPNFGAVVMPTGIIIHDYSPVNFSVVHNIGGINTRVDYLICEHEYEEVEGSTPAYYSVIQGPANGTEPVIPNPSRQVLIAKISIPPGAYTFNEIEITPNRLELLGDNQTLLNYFTQLVVDASTTTKGIIQIATLVETITGLINNKAVTPHTLAGLTSTRERRGLSQQATDLEVVNGLTDNKWLSPAQLKIVTDNILYIISQINITVPQATELVMGIAMLANNTEVSIGENNTKIVTPASLASLLSTLSKRGLSRLGSIQEYYDTNGTGPQPNQNHPVVSLNLLKQINSTRFKVTTGVVTLSGNRSGSGNNYGQNWDNPNKNTSPIITPPEGYTLFLPTVSLCRVFWAGTVDGNDTLWVDYNVVPIGPTFDRFGIWIYGANSEMRQPMVARYSIIWIKKEELLQN